MGHDLIRDLVKEVVVCDPKRNKLLREGSKGDKLDARKLADLLRVGMLRSVWHGHEQTRGLKQMVRAYETFTIDTKRTMNQAIDQPTHPVLRRRSDRWTPRAVPGASASL